MSGSRLTRRQREELEFYAGLFGWQFTEVTPPGLPFRYLIATLDGADVAGIGGPSTPAAPGSGGSAWDTYVAVDDAAATAEAATAAGGRIITEPEARRRPRRDSPTRSGGCRRRPTARRPTGM